MKQNKINYYNTDDEIQFQKLDDFRKFNKNIKVNKSEIQKFVYRIAFLL